MNKAALLVNLGSPKSTDVGDVKTYLDEFLMDDHVIDYPQWLRSLVVRGIILNTRPKRSAKAYESIWWEEGSPLIILSERLRSKVQSFTDIPVGLAMRYAEPSIKNGIAGLEKTPGKLDELLLIPLYPQFAMSSYETVVDKTKEVVSTHFPHITLLIQEPFYYREDYITVLSNSIAEQLPQDHHLKFSYHGIPLRHLRKSDPTNSHCTKVNDCCNVTSVAHETCYRHQCLDTTKRVAEKLQLGEDAYSHSFQSRLGLAKWLEPYTAKELAELPGRGIKKLAIVCPAFVSDCLETLEEINEEGKEIFMKAGGESFQTISCLNDRDDWAKLIARWVDDRWAN